MMLKGLDAKDHYEQYDIFPIFKIIQSKLSTEIIQFEFAVIFPPFSKNRCTDYVPLTTYRLKENS